MTILVVPPLQVGSKQCDLGYNAATVQSSNLLGQEISLYLSDTQTLNRNKQKYGWFAFLEWEG